MSHTGRVHQSNESPGVIRIITSGYALSKNGKLIFRVPKRDKHSGTLDDIKNRFIAFVGSKKLPYGEPVFFNLKLVKKVLEDEKSLINKDKTLTKENLKELKESIPDYWREKVGEREFEKEFQFKYYADTVDKIPEDYILYPFFHLLRNLQQESVENFIEEVADLRKYDLIQNLKIKIDKATGKANKHTNISEIEIMEADRFDYHAAYMHELGNVSDPPFFVGRDEKGVDDEIDKKGEHATGQDELPRNDNKKTG